MSEWISVDDRMPDDGARVEVLCADGKVREAIRIAMDEYPFGECEGWMVNATEDFFSDVEADDSVTHWRPQ
jgi:hypothetical protein